jgi:hypothetical protein
MLEIFALKFPAELAKVSAQIVHLTSRIALLMQVRVDFGKSDITIRLRALQGESPTLLISRNCLSAGASE